MSDSVRTHSGHNSHYFIRKKTAPPQKQCTRTTWGWKHHTSVAKCCLLHVWLCDPADCSLPGSSVNGILQPRILEWIVIPFSRKSSQPRDWTQVSCTTGKFFTIYATKEMPILSSSENYIISNWTAVRPNWLRGHTAQNWKVYSSVIKQYIK